MQGKGFTLEVNTQGVDFYKKWKKDSVTSLIIAPFFLIFILGCFTLIVGLTLKFCLIAIFPTILIIGGFILSPLFGRKKYINNMVKNLSVKDDKLSIETYKWFLYPPIYITLKLKDIESVEVAGEKMFKGTNLILLKNPIAGINQFYIVEEFFDKIIDLKKQVTQFK